MRSDPSKLGMSERTLERTRLTVISNFGLASHHTFGFLPTYLPIYATPRPDPTPTRSASPRAAARRTARRGATPPPCRRRTLQTAARRRAARCRREPPRPQLVADGRRHVRLRVSRRRQVRGRVQFEQRDARGVARALSDVERGLAPHPSHGGGGLASSSSFTTGACPFAGEDSGVDCSSRAGPLSPSPSAAAVPRPRARSHWLCAMPSGSPTCDSRPPRLQQPLLLRVLALHGGQHEVVAVARHCAEERARRAHARTYELASFWRRFVLKTRSPQLDDDVPTVAQPPGTTEGTHGVHAPAWVGLRPLVPAPAPPCAGVAPYERSCEVGAVLAREIFFAMCPPLQGCSYR